MRQARSFKSCLEQGKFGEEVFLKMWPELTKLDGRAGDFLAPDFQLVEVKTDSYSMTKTENFFIELWSDFEKQRPGGPYQAWGRGCTLFCYTYLPERTCFVFKTHELIKALQEMKLENVAIRNKSWTTIGYKVPRSAIQHLAIKVLKAA